MFKGSCVAIVTPMTPQGEVDEATFAKLIEWHIEEGTAAIVVAGSTGEGATLTEDEQLKLFKLAVDLAKKRIPIIAGTGTNSTTTTIARTKAAQDIGVDACLVVTPYYNRPTQAGLIAHYTALAQATDLPIILYNVPSRTGCDSLPETVAKLSEIPNIIGIKEATGNLDRLQQIKNTSRKDFLFYSGDDPTAKDFILQGGHGVISITSNVAPRLMQEMCRLALKNDEKGAKEVDDLMADLHRTLIIEPNPIPVKWALFHLGKIENAIRLPLLAFSIEHHDKMKKALQTANVRF